MFPDPCGVREFVQKGQAGRLSYGFFGAGGLVPASSRAFLRRSPTSGGISTPGGKPGIAGAAFFLPLFGASAAGLSDAGLSSAGLSLAAPLAAAGSRMTLLEAEMRTSASPRPMSK